MTLPPAALSQNSTTNASKNATTNTSSTVQIDSKDCKITDRDCLVKPIVYKNASANSTANASEDSGKKNISTPGLI